MIAQVQIGAHPKYDSTPMRSSTHQWNLSRFFGSQPVGCASSTSWPEAGIATRIIPAQSSRRVFRQPSNADLTTWHLATCRPADLATWRLGESDHRGYRPSHSPPATAKSFRPHSTPMSRNSPEADPPEHAKPFQARAIVQATSLVSSLGIIFQQSTLPNKNSEEAEL